MCKYVGVEVNKKNKLSSEVGTSIGPTNHRGAWLH